MVMGPAPPSWAARRVSRNTMISSLVTISSLLSPGCVVPVGWGEEVGMVGLGEDIRLRWELTVMETVGDVVVVGEEQFDGVAFGPGVDVGGRKVTGAVVGVGFGGFADFETLQLGAGLR